jgi:hypothetical protein
VTRLQVVFTDTAGFPNRREQLSRIATDCGADFTAISPDDMALGIQQATIPPDWLPMDTPYPQDHWLRAGYYWIAAIQALDIQASHYIGIEGDVHGDDDAWRHLFSAKIHDGIDLAGPFIRSHGGHHMHGCMAILSRRAVDWVAASAESTRSIHHEHAIPSTVAANGGRLADLRKVAPKLFSRLTLRYCQPDRPDPAPLIRPAMLSHPCKWDEVEQGNPPKLTSGDVR